MDDKVSEFERMFEESLASVQNESLKLYRRDLRRARALLDPTRIVDAIFGIELITATIVRDRYQRRVDAIRDAKEATRVAANRAILLDNAR